MAEWLKAHAWKACIGNPYPGFESLSLRICKLIHVVTGARLLWAADALVCPNLINSIDSVSLMREITVW